MLIVNADDLGRSHAATDAILACHAAGGVTSTSAMVFMEDSERAAQAALAAGIDVGLHINFSEALTASSTPPSVRDSQAALSRFLKRSKYALVVYHPFLRRQFRDTFAIQHAEFVRLYHREPSHFDGHQHLHLASNMLVDRVIPEGTRVRRSFSFEPGERSPFNRIYRRLVDRSLARRHVLTDYFFSLTFDRADLHRITALAKEANVELMVHPERPKELEFLMGPEYLSLFATVDGGTYADLAAVSRRPELTFSGRI